jgi:hypothetical protein
MVWMQMESFPNFRKLWGKIETNLSPGNYKVSILNSILNNLSLDYNVTSFSGRKYFILKTENKIGTNYYLGYVFAISGGFCLIVVFILLIAYLKNNDKKFNYLTMKWD